MRICSFSDTHGYLPDGIKESDITIICGDIVPLYIQGDINKCKKWIRNKFIPWAESLPCEKVIVIGGNHDFVLDRNDAKENFENSEKVVYLNNEIFEYDGHVIYGTPLCHIFGGWAFMISDEAQEALYAKKLSELESEGKKIDIIAAHDAPYGVSDVLLDNIPWNTHEHIGCKPLFNLVEKVQPKLMFHGHLHSTNHECEKLGNTDVYNVSLLNERYEPVFMPLYLDL